MLSATIAIKVKDIADLAALRCLVAQIAECDGVIYVTALPLGKKLI
jgi:hypothetical protein